MTMPDRKVNQGEYAREDRFVLRDSQKLNDTDPTLKNSSPDRQLTVKGLLLLGLRQAINLCDVPGQLTFQGEEIPLSKTKETHRVRYLSAIALQLTDRWQLSPLEIATQLTSHLQRDLEGLRVEVMPSGMMQLEVADSTLASWLQTLTQTSLPLPNSKYPLPPIQPPLSDDSLFPLQYSHARCCSLLRMAHREGSIVLANPNPDRTPSLWQFLTPNPIPWVNPDRTLRFTQTAETHLISQLLVTADALYEPTAPRPLPGWLKLANALSLAFQTFYDRCRLWGEVKIQTPELVQARFGLVAVTQSLLRSLLQDILKTVAPLEL